MLLLCLPYPVMTAQHMLVIATKAPQRGDTQQGYAPRQGKGPKASESHALCP